MATASPTPMSSHHFAGPSRRPSSRQAYKQPPARPPLQRNEPLPAPSRQYSLNDSSDDEIPQPMKFSALTKALLNDEASVISKSPDRSVDKEEQPKVGSARHTRAGSASLIDSFHKRNSPPGTRGRSPFPRRVVRLSGTPGSSTLRRTASMSSASKLRSAGVASAADSLLDLNTPDPVPKTVRIPTTGNKLVSGGLSGRSSARTNSEPRREDEEEDQEAPTTAARSHLAISQGSVSRYGPSTIGRRNYGEDVGLQSSKRVKRVGKVAGTFLSGPARRGRRRQDDEDQSPIEEQENALEAAGSREPQSQEPESQDIQSQDQNSSRESERHRPSLFSSTYRDFASGSPISSNVDAINSMLRSKSPPPPRPSSTKQASAANSRPNSNIVPVFKVPPRPDLPSAHDQENEAPPTFRRNKQAPLIHLDKMEKIPVRPASLDLSAMRAESSPERRPLAPRSHNTPRRPAPPPPKMSVLDAATTSAGAATTSHANGKRNRLKVNGKVFTKLEIIGRGGSSRVYRVMAENSKIFALKRVSLDDADELAIRGFKGEIDLLKKLGNVDRVIHLYDYEMNDEKGILSVLMEMGELDLNTILHLRLKSEQAKFDVSFVRHYWKEMLECLEAVHEHDIVHSDLKPHNFVLVQGRLKLIDFGIANAIQTDETVNVHRENQIGTPNYMSPESLMDSNAKPHANGRISNEPKLMKLGKPSDVWSLGCILYQMVYGRAPFAHIQNQMQRCQAIINFNYAIEFPTLGVGSVPVPGSLIKTLKKCLNRDQFSRPSATELLSDRDLFLNPLEYNDSTFPMTEELLGRILQNVASKCKDRVPTEAELLTLWPAGYFASLRKNAKQAKVV